MMFLLLTLALLTFTNAQLSLDLDLSLAGAPRSGLDGVLTGDGQVVFAGGITGALGSATSKAVDVISTVDNVVSVGSALSVSRFALAASTAANFSIFAGGISAAPLIGSLTFSADVDVYDATTATWNTTTLAVARAYHCVGSTADFLYIAGGEVAAGIYTDSVEVFVAATGQIDASLNFNLSVARAYLATATLDTTVYFAGGLNSSTEVTAVVDVYDTVNASLTTVELSEARQQIAAVAVGTQVFFAGGASASNVASATVDIWDSTTGNFTTASLSVARWGIRAVVVGDLVLFLGGYTALDTASAVVDMYNVTAQAWETATVLAHARANFAAVAADNKVYLAGGVSAGLAALLTGSGSLEVLDFNTGNSTGIPTPTPSGSENLTVTIVTFANARASLAATVNGAGELLIGGGVGLSAGISAVFTGISSIDITAPADAVDLSQLLSVARLGLRAETAANVSVFAGGALLTIVPSAAVDIYYAANNSWRTASLAVARVYHASAVVGTKIYFAGGQTATAFTNTIESYDTQTGAWVTLSAKLSVGRGYLTASVVGDLIVFAGGRSGTLIATAVASDVVDVLDTVAGTITSATLSVARSQLAASVVGDLVLIGGGLDLTGSASVVVDVWNSTAQAFLNASEFGSSVGRYALEAVTLGTDVYFVGGYDGTNAYATVDIWSSVTGTWTVKQLTYPRYNFAATVDVNGNAYFCGGQSSSVNFLASVEITAGESSTGTPTPTPGETPTPTPVVVPTPTPGVTPTPTPGVNDCVTLCITSFGQAQDSWIATTDFTVQCSGWDTLFTCLGLCTNDNTGALGDQTASCSSTANIQYFCPCARSDFAFNASAAVLFINSNNNNFVSRFNKLPGVVGSPNSGTGTSLTVDVNRNTLTNTFTYEDTAVGGTVGAIEIAWSVDLALFFNTNSDNFVVSQSKKRTQQTATLQVNVADNNNSGVSQLSVSFAFVLVTFLLHVLF